MESTDLDRPRLTLARKTFLFIAILALLVSLLTCFWFWRHLQTGHELAPAMETPLQVKINVDEAAANWRWVGKLHLGIENCPAGPGLWKLLENELQLPFCVYEHPQEGGDLSSPPTAFNRNFRSLDRDIQAVIPLGRPVEPGQSDHFLAAAGATQVQLGSLSPQQIEGPIPRLAILDTAPTNRESPEADSNVRSPHGYSLVHMALRLLCQSSGGEFGPCAADVVTQLALPRNEFHPADHRASRCAEGCDGRCGGTFGMITDLARAIDQEMLAWNFEQPLILNLSLGWDGELYGGLSPTNFAPADAVFQSLCRATKAGALVVAAAGNRRWGPDEATRGALPAAWEELEDWRSFCDTASLNATDSNSAVNENTPLLYAAGGTRIDNRPLANARRGAAYPRFSAFADHAVVEPVGGNEPTQTLTGTSVGALVVSATAAALWQLDRTLSSSDVMDILHESGQTIAPIADFFYPGSTNPSSVRVNMCRALQKAGLNPGAKPCPLIDGTADPYEPKPWIPDLTIEGAALASAGSVDSCNTTILAKESSFSDFPCPHLQLPGLQTIEGTSPSPSTDMCPDCPIINSSNPTAYLQLTDETPVETDTVILAIGDLSYRIALPPYESSKNWPPQIAVRLKEFPRPDDLAVISIEVHGRRSLTSPLLLVP